MSKVNGKKIVSAAMHANIFVPGIGEIKKELSTVHSGINKEVGLELDEPFVLITTKKAGKPLAIPVPLTNFAHLVLADD